MPKIKVEPVKSRVWRKISDFLVAVATSRPDTERGIISWLQKLKRVGRSVTNQKPKNLDLDLDCIWICEVLPMEVLEKHIPKISSLFAGHKSQRFVSMGSDSKDRIFHLIELKDNIHSNIRGFLGLLDFKDVKSNNHVDYMTVQYQSFAGGHVAFIFRIVPNETFKNKLQNILNLEIQPYTVIRAPGVTDLLRGWWGSVTFPAESKKTEEVRNLLVGLKSYCAKYLTQTLTGLLFKKGFHIPSIEHWIFENRAKGISQDLDQMLFPNFWESIGLGERTFGRFEEPSSTFFLHLPEQRLNDFSIKILSDKSKFKESTGGPDSQIQETVNEWIPTLFAVWTTRSMLLDLVDFLNLTRLQVFKAKKNKTGRLFKWTSDIFDRDVMLKRIKKDFDVKSMTAFFPYSGIPDFERKFGNQKSHKLNDELIDDLTYLERSAQDLLDSIKDFVKTSIETVSIRTNYKTQIYVLFLSIFMAVTSFLSIATGSRLCDLEKMKPLCEFVSNLLN